MNSASPLVDTKTVQYTKLAYRKACSWCVLWNSQTTLKPVGYSGTHRQSRYQLGTVELSDNLDASWVQRNSQTTWIPVGYNGTLRRPGYQLGTTELSDDLDTSWAQRNSQTTCIPVGYNGTLRRPGYQLGTTELSDDLDTSWVQRKLSDDLDTSWVQRNSQTTWIPVRYNGTLRRPGYQLGTTELSDDLDTS
ncbi:hypothetical protein HNY73_009022 [Argiope bruennichi]|uniref:Uncharacterized protein n=1 Tax=Argiope bruennichi TaxID=94029 RepID=A0A8T0F961_ARGBR|nr:hypothetical protein HNY73_009022 [Argiope bruennichi]